MADFDLGSQNSPAGNRFSKGGQTLPIGPEPVTRFHRLTRVWFIGARQRIAAILPRNPYLNRRSSLVILQTVRNHCRGPEASKPITRTIWKVYCRTFLLHRVLLQFQFSERKPSFLTQHGGGSLLSVAYMCLRITQIWADFLFLRSRNTAWSREGTSSCFNEFIILVHWKFVSLLWMILLSSFFWMIRSSKFWWNCEATN